MRRNRGITSTIAGAISAHRYARNKRSRPGKRSRANAYAAVALVSTCPATTASEKIRLFNRKRPNGSARAYVSHPPPLPRLPLLPSGLRMLHPPIEQLELGPGRPEEHRDEQQGERARIAELQQLPADPVDARQDHV